MSRDLDILDQIIQELDLDIDALLASVARRLRGLKSIQGLRIDKKGDASSVMFGSQVSLCVNPVTRFGGDCQPLRNHLVDLVDVANAIDRIRNNLGDIDPLPFCSELRDLLGAFRDGPVES